MRFKILNQQNLIPKRARKKVKKRKGRSRVNKKEMFRVKDKGKVREKGIERFRVRIRGKV